MNWKDYRWLRWPHKKENNLPPWWWMAWACILLPFYLLFILLACVLCAMANFSIQAGIDLWKDIR